MADENKEFWDKIRGKLRRALDLDPLCQEESEREYKKTKPTGPLPDTHINAIMEFAQSFGESGGMTVEPEQVEEDEPAVDWTDPVKAVDMEAELMELVNRNRGDQDEETDDLLDKHRDKELGDDEQDGEDEDADDRKNSP